jgi:hypothetical protein
VTFAALAGLFFFMLQTEVATLLKALSILAWLPLFFASWKEKTWQKTLWTPLQSVFWHSGLQ